MPCHVTFFILFLGLLTGHANAEPPKHQFKIERSVDLVDDDDNDVVTRVEVDLGELPAGASGIVVVKLRNQTSKVRRFTEVRAACACIQPEMSSKTLKPNESCLLTLTLNTAIKLNTPESLVVVRILGDKDPDGSVDLKVSYRLRGMLSFQQAMYAPEIDPQMSMATVRIPFYATQPIDPTLLDIAARPDPFSKTWIEAHPTDRNTWILAMEFKVSSIPPSGYSSAVTLEDFQVHQKADVVLVLNTRQPIRVSPRSMRFNADADNKKLVASCIILVNRPEEKTEEKPKASPSIYVGATVGGKNLTVASKPIGENLYRCNLSCSLEFFDQFASGQDEVNPKNDPFEVQWEIVSGKVRAVFSSPILISIPHLVDKAVNVPSEE